MDTYRVFISYSHEDSDLARKIVEVLRDNGLTPMWDEDLSYGLGFPEQLKIFIAHAHVFLPIITESSSKRGWVHQEIGYAMALNVPVLPVTLESAPGQMIRELQAVRVPKDLHNLEKLLSRDVFDILVDGASETSLAIYRVAELHEDRTLMMAKYANDVINLGVHGFVRQKGGLSSFNIPKNTITHPVWKQRYSSNNPTPNLFHCRCQRMERLALERHAKQSGCRLIINPNAYKEYSSESRIIRLTTLKNFLENMRDDAAQVAINPEMPEFESLTIVGDWFAAECVSSPVGRRFQQTVFTRYAPAISTKIELFDQEFEELLNQSGWDAASSKIQAINEINSIISSIKEMASKIR